LTWAGLQKRHTLLKKILQKSGANLVVENHPSVTRGCLTFHHKLTTKTPHPVLNFSKNPSKNTDPPHRKKHAKKTKTATEIRRGPVKKQRD